MKSLFRQTLAEHLSPEEPAQDWTIRPPGEPWPTVPSPVGASVPLGGVNTAPPGYWPPVALPAAPGWDIPSPIQPQTVDRSRLMQDALTLPAFERASEIRPENIVQPDVLIEALLHKSCKLIISGGSKSFKSWSLLDMGEAVSTGGDWWGMRTVKSTVLYINFELIDGFFKERIMRVAAARGIALPYNFLYWNLRGKCYDLEALTKILKTRFAALPPEDIPGLIIVDPIYKALGDLDENSAGDMGKLMLLIEQLSDSIGAAVVFGAHYAKGNQASKEAIDRASGSGVFARDPDSLMFMTRHEEKDCYVVECELRYLAPLSPFVVRWGFPLMRPDESLDPLLVYAGKVPDKKAEKESLYTAEDVYKLLPTGGLIADSWKKTVSTAFGKVGKDFYAFKAALMAEGRVIKQGAKYYPKSLQLRYEVQQ